jgi:hypothetical protein
METADNGGALYINILKLIEQQQNEKSPDITLFFYIHFTRACATGKE